MSVICECKLHEKSYHFLFIIYSKKASQKVRRDEILTARALFAIYSRVTTLRTCYMNNALSFI